MSVSTICEHWAEIFSVLFCFLGLQKTPAQLSTSFLMENPLKCGEGNLLHCQNIQRYPTLPLSRINTHTHTHTLKHTIMIFCKKWSFPTHMARVIKGKHLWQKKKTFVMKDQLLKLEVWLHRTFDSFQLSLWHNYTL